MILSCLRYSELTRNSDMLILTGFLILTAITKKTVMSSDNNTFDAYGFRPQQMFGSCLMDCDIQCVFARTLILSIKLMRMI